MLLYQLLEFLQYLFLLDCGMVLYAEFTELPVWIKSRELYNDLRKAIQKIQNEKHFDLARQMSRSSGSIMDNIAEGFGRGGNAELKQFLCIARGSASELQSQIFRAYDEALLSDDERLQYLKTCSEVIKQINGFVKFLDQSKIKGPRFKK